MANPLVIEILTKYLGADQARAAAADLDKVTASTVAATASTSGLVTAIPDLDAKTAAYVITTQAEYKAIQQAHDALAARIPILAAAGKSTVDFEKSLANLSVALSTENALQIAGRIEAKASAAALTEQAGAAVLNTTAMREMMVVTRELERGNISRLPGSLSLLLAQFGTLNPLITGGFIAAAAGGFLLFEHIKKINDELKKMRENEASIQASIWDDQRAATDRAADAAQTYADKLRAISENYGAVKNAESDRLAILNATLDAQKQILEAQEKAELIAANGDAVKEAQIRAKYGDAKSAGDLNSEQQRLQLEASSLRSTDFDIGVTKKRLDFAHKQNVAANAPDNPENIAAAAAKAQEDILTNDKDSGQKALLENLFKLTGGTDYETSKARFGSDQAQVEADKKYQATHYVDSDTALGFSAFALKVEKEQAALKAVDDNQKAINEQTSLIEAHKLKLKELQKQEDAATAALKTLTDARNALAEKYQTDVTVLSIHKDTAAKTSDIETNANFSAAVAAELAPAGTKISDQQQAAIAQVKGMFDQIHGSFQVFVDHLKNFHGTAAQMKAWLEKELADLKTEIGKTGG